MSIAHSSGQSYASADAEPSFARISDALAPSKVSKFSGLWHLFGPVSEGPSSHPLEARRSLQPKLALPPRKLGVSEDVCRRRRAEALLLEAQRF